MTTDSDSGDNNIMKTGRVTECGICHIMDVVHIIPTGLEPNILYSMHKFIVQHVHLQIYSICKDLQV